MTDLPEVKPGQVWADNDPRSQPRKIQVLRVEGRFAYVRTHTFSAHAAAYPGAGRKETRIQLVRFNPNRMTGYTLIGEEDLPS